MSKIQKAVQQAGRVIVFFINNNGNPPTVNQLLAWQNGVGWLGERGVIIMRCKGFGIFNVLDVDHLKTRIPDSSPHFITNPQCVMQPVLIA